MPQPKDDPRGREIFEFEGAGADLQRDRSKVRLPNLVESVGTDGRFFGAIRPFPGFADDSIHGIPGQTLTNIRLAKYVAIRKGLGDGVLRGIVFLADNTQDKSLVGASTNYRWQASQEATHTNSYYLRYSVESRVDDTVDSHVPVPSDAVLVINGTPTSRTGTFPGTALSEGQWGVHPTAFTNDLGTGEISTTATNTIYYRAAGSVDPDTLADGYVKIRLPGWGVYFSYWDSDSGSSGTVQLDDLRMLEGDPLGATLTDYDFGCNGRYIYLVTGKRASRAYWYDFAYTSWQSITAQMESRYMGIYSPTALFEALSFDDNALYPLNVEGAGPVTMPENFPLGTYWGGIEVVSRKHGLRSRLLVNRAVVDVSENALRYSVSKLDMPQYGDTDASRKVDGRWISGLVTGWGLQHWDSLRVWRKLKEDETGLDGTAASTRGTYYLESEISKAFNPYTDAYCDALFGAASYTFTEASFAIDAGAMAFDLAGFVPDLALGQTLNSYDPYIHEVGRVPESTRIVCLDGVTVVVAKPFVFADTEKEWSYEGTLSESIMYSSLVMGEKENFPVSNIWRPSQPGEIFHALAVAGDYIVALGSSGVHRLLQNGTEMAGTTLVKGTGGVSRWGITSVGASVFFVSPSGLKELDVNTGSIRNLAAVDRIIFDDRQWGSSLESVHLAYDSYAGALILLNTAEDECVILWEATGQITTLVDCPWSFLTQGPDAKTGKNQRAYFVMSAGNVHCIDADRQMAVKSMCGAGGGTDDVLVNGTVAASSSSTVINVAADGTNDIPDECLGFQVYIQDGNLAGESSTISERNGDLQFTVSPPFSGTPDTGSSFSIAPIVFRVTCPQIRGSNGDYDSFEYKKLQTVSAAFTGVDGGAGVGTFQVGAYRRTTKLDGVDIDFTEKPDQCIGHVNAAGTQLYPYIESTMANLDFELQALLTRSSLTGSEAESRQGS